MPTTRAGAANHQRHRLRRGGRTVDETTPYTAPELTEAGGFFTDTLGAFGAHYDNSILFNL
ncbi:hypothetical protein GCM10023222_42000 [Saccharopolyspora cebuensis]